MLLELAMVCFVGVTVTICRITMLSFILHVLVLDRHCRWLIGFSYSEHCCWVIAACVSIHARTFSRVCTWKKIVGWRKHESSAPEHSFSLNIR